MAGYLIVRVNVTDPKAYEEYKKLARFRRKKTES